MAVSRRIDLFIRPNSTVSEEAAWDYAYRRANERDMALSNRQGSGYIDAHYYDITDTRTSKKWMVFGDLAQDLLKVPKWLVILDLTDLEFGEIDLTPEFQQVKDKIDALDFSSNFQEVVSMINDIDLGPEFQSIKDKIDSIDVDVDLNPVTTQINNLNITPNFNEVKNKIDELGVDNKFKDLNDKLDGLNISGGFQGITNKIDSLNIPTEFNNINTTINNSVNNIDLSPEFQSVKDKIDGLQITGSTEINMGDFETILNTQLQDTKNYIREVNDIIGSEVRTVFRYGFLPLDFYGATEYIVMIPDVNISFRENIAQKYLDSITIDTETKIVDCNNLSLKQTYHALHLHQCQTETKDYILKAEGNRVFGLWNDWNIINYQFSSEILDYRYIGDEKISLVRDVEAIITIPNTENEFIATIKITDRDFNEIHSETRELVDICTAVDVPTDGSYIIDLEVTENGSIVYKDIAPLMKRGYEAKSNLMLIDPDSRESVIYLNAPSPIRNNEMLTDIKAKIPEELRDDVNVYVDVTSDAYDSRGSYDKLMVKCANGEIRRIFIYEYEVFGTTRWEFTLGLLDALGVDVIESKEIPT